MLRRHERHQLAVTIVASKLDQQRHIGELGITFEAHLHQNENLLLREPLRLGRFPGGPRVRAAAEYLAALHRDVDLVAARITGHDLELHAGELVEQRGVDHTGGTLGGAHHQLLGLHVFDPGDAGGVPGIDHVGRAGGVADPAKLARVELDARQVHRLRRHHVGHDHVDGGAVLGGDVAIMLVMIMWTVVPSLGAIAAM